MHSQQGNPASSDTPNVNRVADHAMGNLSSLCEEYQWLLFYGHHCTVRSSVLQRVRWSALLNVIASIDCAPKPDFCFGTWLIKNVSYVQAAIVLGESMRVADPGIPRVVLVDDEICRDKNAVPALRRVYNYVIRVPLISRTQVDHTYWRSFKEFYGSWLQHCFTRLQVFNIPSVLNVRKILLFDADCLVMTPLWRTFFIRAPAGKCSVTDQPHYDRDKQRRELRSFHEFLERTDKNLDTYPFHDRSKPLPAYAINLSLKYGWGMRGCFYLFDLPFKSEPEGNYGDSSHFKGLIDALSRQTYNPGEKGMYLGQDEELITSYFGGKGIRDKDAQCEPRQTINDRDMLETKLKPSSCWFSIPPEYNQISWSGIACRSVHYVSQKPWWYKDGPEKRTDPDGALVAPHFDWWEDFSLWYTDCFSYMARHSDDLKLFNADVMRIAADNLPMQLPLGYREDNIGEVMSPAQRLLEKCMRYQVQGDFLEIDPATLEIIVNSKLGTAKRVLIDGSSEMLIETPKVQGGNAPMERNSSTSRQRTTHHKGSTFRNRQADEASDGLEFRRGFKLRKS